MQSFSVDCEVYVDCDVRKLPHKLGYVPVGGGKMTFRSSVLITANKISLMQHKLNCELAPGTAPIACAEGASPQVPEEGGQVAYKINV